MRQSMTPTTDPGKQARADRQAQIERNQAALALLNTWDEEGPEGQRETWAFLERALGEDEHTFRRAEG